MGEQKKSATESRSKIKKHQASSTMNAEKGKEQYRRHQNTKKEIKNICFTKMKHNYF